MKVNGYLLDVKWDVDNMPRYIGPFESAAEAEDFAKLNVPNGTWEIGSLAAAYTTRS
ncbi:hypothetical protein [Microbacterium sp. Leaf320]|uniref:hypothetical protein n=1 Tax=Microbacterium sp. Leaf320 TaxID=1736334 RepID=UPI000A71DBC0|nr:hypothetical protein [Microbacterium sp. Leaf320]